MRAPVRALVVGGATALCLGGLSAPAWSAPADLCATGTTFTIAPTTQTDLADELDPAVVTATALHPATGLIISIVSLAVGGALFLSGMFIMAWNVWKTIAGQQAAQFTVAEARA